MLENINLLDSTYFLNKLMNNIKYIKNNQKPLIQQIYPPWPYYYRFGTKEFYKQSTFYIEIRKHNNKRIYTLKRYNRSGSLFERIHFKTFNNLKLRLVPFISWEEVIEKLLYEYI